MTLIYAESDPVNQRCAFLSDCLITRETQGDGESSVSPFFDDNLAALAGIESAGWQSKSIFLENHLLFQWAGNRQAAHSAFKYIKACQKALGVQLPASEYLDMIVSHFSEKELSDLSLILTTLIKGEKATCSLKCDHLDFKGNQMIIEGTGKSAVTHTDELYIDSAPLWNPSGRDRPYGSPLEEAMNRIALFIGAEGSHDYFNYLGTGFWYELATIENNRFLPLTYSLYLWNFNEPEPKFRCASQHYYKNYGVVCRFEAPPDLPFRSSFYAFDCSLGTVPAGTVEPENLMGLMYEPVHYSIHSVYVGARNGILSFPGNTMMWERQNESLLQTVRSDHIVQIFAEAEHLRSAGTDGSAPPSL